MGNFITKWVNHYFEVGHLRVITSWTRAIRKRDSNLFQTEAGDTKWSNFVTTWSRYYKVGATITK